MDGEQLFEITREQAAANGINFEDWFDLPEATQAVWEQMADEQNLRDRAKSAKLPGDRKDEHA